MDAAAGAAVWKLSTFAINALTSATLDPAADYIPFYDVSAVGNRYSTLANMLTAPPAIGGGTPAAISGTVITATSNLVGGSLGSLTGVLSITAPASTNAIDVILNATPSNAIRIRQSGGSNVFTINSVGRTSIRAISDDSDIFNITSAGGTQIYQIGTLASSILFHLRGSASQSGDYIRVQDNSSNILQQLTSLGRLTVNGRDASGLSALVAGVTFGRNASTGTVLAAFGSQIALQLESSTTEATAVGSIDWLWNVATHASRAPDLVFNLIDSAATREIMRMRANGSAGAIGFFGATPVVRATALTQTYSTADRTLSAYTADDESVAYTGIDNLQAGTVYGQVADVNALRVAYENLRALTEDLAAFVNALVDDMQGYGLEQ